MYAYIYIYYVYICYSIFLIDPLFRCHFYFPPTHHFSFLPSLPSLHATSLCFPCACLPFCLVSFLPPPLYVAFSLSKDHSFPKHTPTSNAHSLMLCKQVISTTVGSRLYHCAAICSLHFGDNFNVYLIKICQRHSILLASKCPVSNGIFSNLASQNPPYSNETLAGRNSILYTYSGCSTKRRVHEKLKSSRQLNRRGLVTLTPVIKVP